jgi:streptomycin 6-kinase
MRELRRTFGGGAGPFPPRLVALAEAYFAEAALLDDDVLLHGDLHHENILAATREPWLVIDPKGIVGPRGYECGTYLRNHLLNKADPARVLARRVDQLAEILELERDEILRWGVAHNVLSAWWSFEARGIAAGAGLICAAFCARALPSTSSGGG